MPFSFANSRSAQGSGGFNERGLFVEPLLAEESLLADAKAMEPQDRAHLPD